jgi:hypothetical protein
MIKLFFTKQGGKKVILSLLFLFASLTFSWAAICNCSRTQGAYFYDISWVCDGSPGSALVEVYRNGEFVDFFYVDNEVAPTLCN